MKYLFLHLSLYLVSPIFSQNVGINTSNPQKSLDVYGTAQITA